MQPESRRSSRKPRTPIRMGRTCALLALIGNAWPPPGKTAGSPRCHCYQAETTARPFGSITMVRWPDFRKRAWRIPPARASLLISYSRSKAWYGSRVVISASSVRWQATRSPLPLASTRKGNPSAYPVYVPTPTSRSTSTRPRVPLTEFYGRRTARPSTSAAWGAPPLRFPLRSMTRARLSGHRRWRTGRFTHFSGPGKQGCRTLANQTARSRPAFPVAIPSIAVARSCDSPWARTDRTRTFGNTAK